MRRVLIIVLSLGLFAAAFAARAEQQRPIASLLADGVYARPSYTSVVPPAGTLWAGAARGDISPPFGSAMTGFYADRHCALSTAMSPFARTGEIEREIDGNPADAPYALASCPAAKLGPDTDLYARTHPPSAGRYGRLRANAHVLSDGTTKVALVSVDLPAFFGEMHQAVANRIAARGIPASNLLVSASHTHTGPGGYFGQGLGWAAASGDAYDPRVFGAITDGIVDAIERADEALRPAKMASGTTQITDANWNRRATQWARNPESASDPLNAPRVGMIRIDGVDGEPIGAITNFATHGTVGGANNEWLTGDDKAWVSRLVERGIGGDAVVTSLNGAQGDIGGATANTGGWPGGHTDWGGYAGLLGGPHVFGQFAAMENAGDRQAPGQLSLWASLGSSMTTQVSLDGRLDFLCICGQEIDDDPYDPYDRGVWEPANDDPTYRRISTLAILGANGQSAPTTIVPGHHRKLPLVITPPPVVAGSLRLQVVRVGDVAFATMPGEPTSTMGRRVERSVKAALNGSIPNALVEHVWTAGMAGDHSGYFPTIQEYESYLYESSATMFGQQTGNALKRRLVDLAEWIALGASVPPCTIERSCLEQADSSALVAEPAPLAPDAGVGEIRRQPRNVERFEGTSFMWVGGGPGAQHAPGEALVRLERRDGTAWTAVATDLDPEIPVRYQKRAGAHLYTALMDPPAGMPSGTYRFRVTGYASPGAGVRTPYSLTSDSFTVAPSTRLVLNPQSSGIIAVERPVPDPYGNYRWRARLDAGASVTGTRNGVPVTFTGAIVLAPGDTLVVPAGGIVDAFGNTNAAALTITG